MYPPTFSEVIIQNRLYNSLIMLFPFPTHPPNLCKVASLISLPTEIANKVTDW